MTVNRESAGAVYIRGQLPESLALCCPGDAESSRSLDDWVSPSRTDHDSSQDPSNNNNNNNYTWYFACRFQKRSLSANILQKCL